MTNCVAKTVIAVLSCLVMLEAGCSRSTALSPHAAAQLAAKLANEQCDYLYKRRPFGASQHLAVLQNGTYNWGGFDAAGPGGFSALVSFRADGSEPHVDVYFSCDPPWPLPGLHPPPHFESVPFDLP
jgi:hypothetical protein